MPPSDRTATSKPCYAVGEDSQASWPEPETELLAELFSRFVPSRYLLESCMDAPLSDSVPSQ